MPGKHPQKNLLKKNINVAMDYHKPMMAPKKLKTDVGLHGPFKMVMGAHDKNSPGIMKAHHVQKFSYMYPQGNAFIGAKIKAEKAGKAPKLILEATHEKTLQYASLNLLVKYAFKETSFDE